MNPQRKVKPYPQILNNDINESASTAEFANKSHGDENCNEFSLARSASVGMSNEHAAAEGLLRNAQPLPIEEEQEITIVITMLGFPASD